MNRGAETQPLNFMDRMFQVNILQKKDEFRENKINMY